MRCNATSNRAQSDYTGRSAGCVLRLKIVAVSYLLYWTTLARRLRYVVVFIAEPSSSEYVTGTPRDALAPSVSVVWQCKLVFR